MDAGVPASNYIRPLSVTKKETQRMKAGHKPDETIMVTSSYVAQSHSERTVSLSDLWRSEIGRGHGAQRTTVVTEDHCTSGPL